MKEVYTYDYQPYDNNIQFIDPFEIIQEVKNALKAYDKEHIYRVNIIGEIDYNINFTNEDINRYLNDYFHLMLLFTYYYQKK